MCNFGTTVKVEFTSTESGPGLVNVPGVKEGDFILLVWNEDEEKVGWFKQLVTVDNYIYNKVGYLGNNGLFTLVISRTFS